MAVWIKANGEMGETQPKNGTDFSLEELKGFVDGYIEVVNLPGTLVMVVNEEGKVNGLQVNEKASMLYRYDVIVGDVLICDRSEIK